VESVAVHRNQAHLHVPVVGELLPAHLDIDAHHEIRFAGGLVRGLPAMLPTAFEGKPSEHCRLARSGRRAADRGIGVRGMPEPAEDVYAAGFDLRGLSVLILVDHVLVEALGHQPVGLGLHPGGDERRHVQAGIPVQHQLVVNDLVGNVGGELSTRQLVPGDREVLQAETRGHPERFRYRLRGLGVLEHHRLLADGG
jgi:hypothetical protein